MSYVQYGIDREFVERVKWKMKNPAVKAKITELIGGVTKADLQNRAKVRKLALQCARVLQEPLTERQLENIVNFVIAQKIDPNNTFHLLKLWSMFR